MTGGHAIKEGRFYVCEGDDGSCKTGAMARLAEGLRDLHYDVLTTREPGGTPEGLSLRSLLLAEGGHVWDPRAELLLMTAARVQHVKEIGRASCRERGCQ